MVSAIGWAILVFEVLSILLVGLRAFHVVSWPWYYVLIPLGISIAVDLFACGTLYVFGLAMSGLH